MRLIQDKLDIMRGRDFPFTQTPEYFIMKSKWLTAADPRKHVNVICSQCILTTSTQNHFF